MQHLSSSPLGRRSFLKYVGVGAATFGGLATAVAKNETGDVSVSAGKAWVGSDGAPTWTAPKYPVPLPNQPFDPKAFTTYEVQDDVVLPEGWRYDVVIGWGDRLLSSLEPSGSFHFGYNNDYTGLLPVKGSSTDYWLFVNHEELSFRAWQQAIPEVLGRSLPQIQLQVGDGSRRMVIDGLTLPGGAYDFSDTSAEQSEVGRRLRAVAEFGLGDLGVSVVHLRRDRDGRFHVVQESDKHKRITAISHQGPGRSTIHITGPSGAIVPTSTGTFSNCSGGTTPWGTFMTCEENIQNHTHEGVDAAGQGITTHRRMHVSGAEADNPDPRYINGMGNALAEPMDGRRFGWVCEMDPETGVMAKHSWLGRFRHENIALRVEAGKPLAAYMGDDRRGGHTWKFVSKNAVKRVDDPANSKLFEEGVLYAAKFEEGYKGRWIPLTPETPLVRPEAEHCVSGHIRMPNRGEGGSIGVGSSRRANVTVDEWVAQIEAYTGKPFVQCTLGDLVKGEHKQGVILMDAFLMANAAGATPTARPEDLEVHPVDQSVFIAYTDHTEGSDGSPDLRVFPDARKENTRQYGSIYRLVEDSTDALTFGWGRFVASGEVADQGGGFACCDNLVFDPQANLWMVTDISTSALNYPVPDREGGTAPGEKNFLGVFGNNAMFVIPTKGEQAGVPHLFALGPCECEMTGPTFSDDGLSLILAVQHPGERGGTRTREKSGEMRDYAIAGPKGEIVRQERFVPVGSNWPHNRFNRPPKPCVVCITRV